MTAMTPRDALEVVRDIRTLSDAACSYNGFMAADDDEISNLRNRLGDFDEALAVLTNLVERAGEPVAWRPIETAPRGQYEQIIAGFAEDEEGYSPDSREMWFSEESQMWKLSSDPNWSDPPQPTHWQPLPTAPGASHER